MAEITMAMVLARRSSLEKDMAQTKLQEFAIKGALEENKHWVTILSSQTAEAPAQSEPTTERDYPALSDAEAL